MPRIDRNPPATPTTHRSIPAKSPEASSPQDASANGFEAQHMKDVFETKPAGKAGTSLAAIGGAPPGHERLREAALKMEQPADHEAARELQHNSNLRVLELMFQAHINTKLDSGSPSSIL